MDNKKFSEETRQEMAKLFAVINQHQSDMTRAAESMKQLLNGDAAVVHFEDMMSALKSFPEARKSVEIAKRLIKARIIERTRG